MNEWMNASSSPGCSSVNLHCYSMQCGYTVAMVTAKTRVYSQCSISIRHLRVQCWEEDAPLRRFELIVGCLNSSGGQKKKKSSLFITYTKHFQLWQGRRGCMASSKTVLARLTRDVLLDLFVIPTEVRQLISLEAELLHMPGGATS